MDAEQQAIEREDTRCAADAIVAEEWRQLIAFFQRAPEDKLFALLRMLRLADVPRLCARIRELPDSDLQVLAWFAQCGLIEAALRADAADIDAELPEA